MKKKLLKKSSKRQSLNLKYKINRKVKEHHRKLRKEAKKTKKLGLPMKNKSKITKIPNLFPEKKDMLEEQELMKHIEKLEKSGNKHVNRKDIEALVGESGDAIVKIDRDQQEVRSTFEKKSRADFKREISDLIYKSDFVLEVVDARDPLAYRSSELEKNVEKSKKKLIIVLNKVDLVSKENADAWVKFLRRGFPTVPFSAKTGTQEFQAELLSTIQAMRDNNRRLLVSAAGFPNTGKSSFLSTFQHINNVKKSRNLAGYNEILVDNNIAMFDCAGFVFTKREGTNLMPKTCKHVENLKAPTSTVKQILDTLPHDDILECYETAEFANLDEFMENIAKKFNYFIKKGFLDLDRAAQHVIEDIITGKIRYETKLE